MKRSLFIAFLFLSTAAFSQKFAISLISYPILDSMKLHVGVNNSQYFLSGLNSINDNNGGQYMWNDTSTATNNNFTVVQVTGVATGRYLRVNNTNTLKGSVTLSGGVLQTAYPISFPNTLPSIPAIVLIQAYSANAAVPSWVSNVTTTGFTANFASVPVLGTNNISINYLIIKQ